MFVCFDDIKTQKDQADILFLKSIRGIQGKMSEGGT